MSLLNNDFWSGLLKESESMNTVASLLASL